MLLARSQFNIICSELILCGCFPFRTSWSIVFGTKYCKGHVIVAGIRHATPIFGSLLAAGFFSKGHLDARAYTSV